MALVFVLGMLQTTVSMAVKDVEPITSAKPLPAYSAFDEFTSNLNLSQFFNKPDQNIEISLQATPVPGVTLSDMIQLEASHPVTPTSDRKGDRINASNSVIKGCTQIRQIPRDGKVNHMALCDNGKKLMEVQIWDDSHDPQPPVVIAEATIAITGEDIFSCHDYFFRTINSSTMDIVLLCKGAEVSNSNTDLLYVYINNFVIDQTWDQQVSKIQVPTDIITGQKVIFKTMTQNVQVLHNNNDFWITKYKFVSKAGKRNINLFADQVLNNATTFASGIQLKTGLIVNTMAGAPASTTNNDQYSIFCGHVTTAGGPERNLYRIKLGYVSGTATDQPFDDVEIEEANYKTFAGNGWGSYDHMALQCRQTTTTLRVLTATNTRFVIDYLNIETFVEITTPGENQSLDFAGEEFPLDFHEQEFVSGSPSIISTSGSQMIFSRTGFGKTNMQISDLDFGSSRILPIDGSSEFILNKVNVSDLVYGSRDQGSSFTRFFFVTDDTTYNFYQVFEDMKLTIDGSTVGTLAAGDVQVTAKSMSPSRENNTLTMTVPIASATTWDNTVDVTIDVNKFTVYNDENTNINLGTQAVKGNNVQVSLVSSTENNDATVALYKNAQLDLDFGDYAGAID
jgi:hypothetical protein